MAEKNKNSSESKLVRKMKIMSLAGCLNMDTYFRIPGLTNHIDKLNVEWRDENRRHLCHIMKFFNMGGFQIETFEELKQFVSKIEVPSNEISIREKLKKCFELTDKLEKEIRDYGLYDVLFKLDNSVDKDEELLNRIRNDFWISKSIKEWKEYVYLQMKAGEIKQGTWAEWYILSVAKKQRISDEVRERWSKLMNEAYKLRCNYENAKTRYVIYNCLLFEMQSNDEAKRLKKDLQYALREEPDAYNPPDNLPDDYFLIKSGIITSIDEFINIMKLCIKKKIYLCLDIGKFKKTIIERLIGKTKFFEMIENATPQQIKEIVDIDVKMDDLCGCGSTFDDFLWSSRNSKVVANIMACAAKDKESFSTTFLSPGSFLLKLKWDHLQIRVETFEKFMANCSADSLWDLGPDMGFINALSVGFECCSDDMKNNGKKIDLGHIFPDWAVFCRTMYEDSYWWRDSYYIDKMNNFLNLLFKNINKIKLDDEQITGFLFGTIYDKYGYKLHNFMDALRYEQEAATENNSDNELVKMAIVINAILKKQNLQYKGKSVSVSEMFETKCKEVGTNVSCDQNDIFFACESHYSKKLYLVDKDVGISQFDNGLVFLEYIYKNINTEKGQRYASLLGDYICKNNYFSIYGTLLYSCTDKYVQDNYFYIICLLLNVLKNHNEAKAKIKKLYVDKLKSKWQKFRFMFYSFLVFCFVKHEDVSRFISVVTVNDNKKNIFPSNQIASSEISTVPESEKNIKKTIYKN